MLRRKLRAIFPAYTFTLCSRSPHRLCGTNANNNNNSRRQSNSSSQNDTNASLNGHLASRISGYREANEPPFPSSRRASDPSSFACHPPQRATHRREDGGKRGLNKRNEEGRERSYNAALYAESDRHDNCAGSSSSSSCDGGTRPPIGFDMSPSERVDEVSQGIFLYTNDADDLGFHLPPRYLLSPPANETRQSNDSDSDKGRNSNGNIFSFAFGEPVSTFVVSPVVSAFGCLWQWRPVRFTLAEAFRSAGGDKCSLQVAEEEAEDGHELWERLRVQLSLSSSSPPPLRMLPFLLCPVSAHLPLPALDRGDAKSGPVMGCRTPNSDVRQRLRAELAAMPRLHPSVLTILLLHETPSQEDGSGRGECGNDKKRKEQLRLTHRERMALVQRLCPLLNATLPSPLGESAATTGCHGPHYPSFPGARNRGRNHDPLLAEAVLRPLLASREDWMEQFLCMTLGAQEGMGGEDDGNSSTTASCYSSVYHTSALTGMDSGKATRQGSLIAERLFPAESVMRIGEIADAPDSAQTAAEHTGRSPTKRHKPPLCYHNIVLGPLAETILAVDRLAALVARQELTFSAACLSLLVDTKFAQAVQLLSHGARRAGEGRDEANPCKGNAHVDLSELSGATAIERELKAAVQAQHRLTALAWDRNNTAVGKSAGTTVSLSGLIPPR